MSTRLYPTAQDVENAFYEAIERLDYGAMVSVWAEDEEIVCVHPGGERLRGAEQVLGSWKRIFTSGQRLRFSIAQQSTVTGMMVAVHSLIELITIEGEAAVPQPVVTTNVYLRTASGWRMVVHHASPAPGEAQQPDATPDDGPKILH